MIYFDNAATTLKKPESVYGAVYEAMQNAGNASRGGHDAALTSIRYVYSAREEISELFGLKNPLQVAFTANGTESLNLAIAGMFLPEDHVITTTLEHNSVLRPLYRLKKQGLSLTIIKADDKGNISYKDMEESIHPNTKGIVCTHASNVTGNMLDLIKIGDICKRHQLKFVVDAAQTAGICPINMKEMNIDVLCFTGHKSLLGPQGTGGICVREGVSITPLKVGGSGMMSYDESHPKYMPEALEAGTLNTHGIAGLLAGIRYLTKHNSNALFKREQELMHYFYQHVKDYPNVNIYGDLKPWIRAPIVSLNIKGMDSAILADQLSQRFHIAVRAGAHCAPLMHESLGTTKQGAVRFSFSHMNTQEEVTEGIKAIEILSSEVN